MLDEILPQLTKATVLRSGVRRMFIGAYGFEKRSLGWCRSQSLKEKPLSEALVFRYVHPKGPNKIEPLRGLLSALGAKNPKEIPFNYDNPQEIEDRLERSFENIASDEIVLDISGMTKILILATLCKLERFRGTLRVIYSEAEDYCPNKKQYETVKGQMAATAKFPSRGCEDLIRLRCLSSIRMQGQPVALVAFTSFNEKLVSHMLGHMSPHRLLLINGRPPREDYKWREVATQYIHQKYFLDYPHDNPLDNARLLKRVTSTLDYRETVLVLNGIYSIHGLYERIVCAATGSKMQTVGLFMAKILHPDIQVEYPTPDSYFVRGMSTGVRQIHELHLSNYVEFLAALERTKGIALDGARNSLDLLAVMG
jgi:hypothetical protein